MTDAVLANSGTAGMETISSPSGAFESLTFADPTGTLTVTGNSTDKLQVQSLSSSFDANLDLDLPGGEVDFTGAQNLGGSAGISATAGTITDVNAPLDAGGNIAFVAGSTFSLQNSLTAGGNITLSTTSGSIFQPNANGLIAAAGTATLDAPGGIGAAAQAIQIDGVGGFASVSVVIGSVTAPSAVYLNGQGHLTLGNIATNNGNLVVTAQNAITVAANSVIDTGTGTIFLAADVLTDGSGGSNTGKLSIQSGAVVDSANTSSSAITLRGYDIDITNGANPAIVGAHRSLAGSAAIAISSGLNSPLGLAFDGSGNLFIINQGDNTISEVTAAQLAAGSFNPIVVVSAGLSGPQALAFDGSGNLFIANNISNSVSEVTAVQLTAGNAVASTVISNGLTSPTGLAFDKNGDLFIAEFFLNEVSEVTASQLSAGNPIPTPVVSSGLNAPNSLAFDAKGNLFISNAGNSTVSEVTASQLAAGNAIPATVISSGLNSPRGLAFDGSGNLFIANFTVYTVSEATVSQLAAGNVSATTVISSGLNHPFAAAFDGNGDLFITNLSGSTVSEAAVTLTPNAGGVVIRSSASSDSMSIGGGNSDVAGINLTDAELAQIYTTASGTVTIGDISQTGNITFHTATPVTTAGASVVVQQSQTGGGAIVLDDQNSAAALNGNGGNVSLSAGNGGIVAATANNAFPESATSGIVHLDTNGAIGSATNRIQFNPASRPASVIVGASSSPTAVYLDGLVSVANSTVSVSASTVVPGGTLTLTLQVEDVYGNKETTGDRNVAFQLGAGAGSGAMGNVTDNGNGTYTAILTASTSGQNTITATINGQALTSTPAPFDVAPTATAVAASVPVIADAQVGNNGFSIIVTYSEPMNTAVAPTLAFNPSISSTLTIASGSWNVAQTTYTAVYNVAKAGLTIPSVAVTVSGAADAFGATQPSFTQNAAFAIDTVDPTVTSVTASVPTITDTSVGSHFSVSVTYSDVMNTAVAAAPVLSFGGSGHSAVQDQELLRSLLGVPDDHFGLALMPLGYPRDRPLTPLVAPDRRPFSKVVHRERW